MSKTCSRPPRVQHEQGRGGGNSEEEDLKMTTGHSRQKKTFLKMVGLKLILEGCLGALAG